MDRAETAVSVRRAGPRDLAELDALEKRLLAAR